MGWVVKRVMLALNLLFYFVARKQEASELDSRAAFVL